MWSCAFRRGRQSMSSQDIADRLSGNLIPQIGQGADNPVIAPVPVLAGHAQDQLLERALDPRSAQTSTPLRAIEFAGDKLAVPSQDGVRLRNVRDLGKELAAQAMTDLAQRDTRRLRVSAAL